MIKVVCNNCNEVLDICGIDKGNDVVVVRNHKCLTDEGVSESIFSSKYHTIPMADVQNVEKIYHSCDLLSGVKKGDLQGGHVITKHTTWDCEHDCWSNSIYIDKEELESFLKCWCFYRHELEGVNK